MLKIIDVSINAVINMFQIVVLCLLLTSISARMYPEEFYPSNYFGQGQYSKVKAALEKLDSGSAPNWEENWPNVTVRLGQVSGVAIDNSGRLLVFHRGPNTWDVNTFTSRNIYQFIDHPPIQQATILVYNETGELVDSWGQNIFYIPHGITVDNKDNVWVTDVARHQVFKFTPESRTVPALVLGEKFVPRDDDDHFCKPTAVAVMSSGDFFVADGYCNTRIVKFAPDGTKILQWGKRLGNSPFVLNVPHALALAEERGELCAADRERGRVACFRTDSGAFTASFRNWLVGPRLFGVAYAPVHGGRLYVVNGPSVNVALPVRGYVIDYASGRLVASFAPAAGLRSPHAVAVRADGAALYVAELDPHRVLKFTDPAPRDESTEPPANVTHAKPTATVEVRGLVASGVMTSAWGQWVGPLGGALAAAGAALLIALCRARNTGRKSVARRRWDYGHGEFKLRRLLERRRFTRVHSDDSEDEPAPMLPPPTA